MFEWLLALAPVNYAEPPKKDFVGVVAAEVAYAALLPDTPVTKPLVDTKNCKRCNAIGKIPTGDSNHPWTDCPDCESKTSETQMEMKAAGPNPAPRLQVKPLPPVNSDCGENGCPVPSTISGGSKPSVTSRPSGTYRK
jgi:hypothetical protein